MTKKTNISRRDGLKGIFAAGTIIGGAGAGFTLVAANDDADESNDAGVDEIDFRGCSSVFVVLEDEDALPLEVTIRVFDEETNGFENVAVTITSENVRQIPGQFGQRPVYEFDVHQFFDRPESSDDKILAVTVGDESAENTNRCAENVPENGSGGNGEDQNGDDDDENGDDENGNGDEPIDPDEIRLVAICVDSANDRARFRIDNDTDQEVDLEYEVYSSGDRTPITVEANSTTYFDVDAAGGEATVTLHLDDEQIDVKASNTEEMCEYENGENGEGDPDEDDDEDPDDGNDEDPGDDDDEDPDDGDDEDPDDDDDEDPKDEAGDKGGHIDTDKIDLIAVCRQEGAKKKDGTKDEHRGKFRVENHTKTDATFSWNADGDQSGTISVPEKDSKTFWVDFDSSAKTTVTLYYEDERIDEQAVNVDECCEK